MIEERQNAPVGSRQSSVSSRQSPGSSRQSADRRVFRWRVSQFSMLNSQSSSRWLRLILFVGVVVLLSLAGAGLGRGFGADVQPALLAQTIGPQPTPAESRRPSSGSGTLEGPPLELVADYMAGTIITMLKWWLGNDMPYTPEQLGALFYELVLPGVQATLRIEVRS